MRWTFGDGTVLHLGGQVDGSTQFAHTLRRTVGMARRGLTVIVQTLPPPGGEALKLDDPWHMRCLARSEAGAYQVAVVDEPDVAAPAEWDEDDGPESSVH